MKIELIDYTGAGSADPLYAGKLFVYTKNTRLSQNADTRREIFEVWSANDILKELDYISKTIRSSWEFVDFTFSIQGVTRAFTHQLVRTRTASYAQQSQRSVDMRGFETLMPKSLEKAGPGAVEEWEDCMMAIENAYNVLLDNGIPAEDARGLLPTNILTNIIMKVNLRTLADLVGKRINPRAQGEYTEFVSLATGLTLETMPWTKPFLFPERTATPALDKLLTEALGTATPFSKPEVNAALKELDSLKGVWG